MHVGLGVDDVHAGLVLQVDDVGCAAGQGVQDGEGAGGDRGQAGGEGQHLNGDVGSGGGGDDLLELTPADGQVLAVVIGEHPAVQHRLVDHRVQPQGAPLRSGVEDVLASAAGLHPAVDLDLGQLLPGGQDDLPVVVRALQQ